MQPFIDYYIYFFNFIHEEDPQSFAHVTHGNPIPQNMRVYDEPRSSETAFGAKEYLKGTAFAQKYDTIIDKHIVNSGITNKVPTKRVDRDAAELYHENGYPIFDTTTGREIEYDFNPNVPSPVKTNNDASQPSKMNNTNNNEEK